MKNVLYLFITCFITTVSFAQTQIDKDFQGYWKLSELSAGGVRINIDKSTVIFSKERESKMTAEQKANAEAKKGEVIKKLSESHVLVSAKNIDIVLGDIKRNGVFKIEKYIDAYKLSIGYEDGTADEMIMYIKNKKLYLTKSDDVDRDEMIFTKTL